MNKVGLLKRFSMAFIAVVAMVLLAVGLSACGETDTVITPSEGTSSTKGLSYVLSKDSDGTSYATVSAYNGESTSVNVASHAGGYPVKSINASAFSNNANLTSIALPSTIDTLPDNAFSGCTSLTSINAIGVEIVGENAFLNTAWFDAKPDNSAVYFNDVLCAYKGSKTSVEALKTLTLDANTVSIAKGVLPSLIALENVDMPDNIKHFRGIFDNLATIKKFTVFSTLSSDKTVSSVDDVLYTADGKELVKFPEGKKANNFTINSTVKKIGDKSMQNISTSSINFNGVVDEIGSFAFFNTASLSNLTFSNNCGYKKIGDSAFEGSALTSIQFPSMLEIIGANAFSKSKLVTIDFGTVSSLSTIGENAFKSSSQLVGTSEDTYELILPNSLITLGDNAFYNCPNIVSIDTGSNLVKLGGASFYNARNLKELKLSPVLEEIGGSAFWGCIQLKSLTLPLSLKAIGSSAFKGCTDLGGVYFGDQSVSNPKEAQLKSIGISAFENCSKFTNFDAPYTLETIGANAFKGCTQLATFNVLRSKSSGITECGQYAFDNIISLQIITPIDSQLAYQDATGWTTYSTSIYAKALDDGSMYLFFDTGDMGLLRDLSATNAIVLQFDYCNIKIEDQVSSTTKETVEGNKKTVVTTTTTKEYVLDGWYTSKDMTDNSKIEFVEGIYTFSYESNTYITIYAKWSIISTQIVKTEVYEN